MSKIDVICHMSGPDIFFSYAREDQARVAPVVAALEAQGWSVFWDRRIPAGQTWRSHIGRALDQSRSVVVAWSEHSINSKWVLEEADEGIEREILVPVLLDAVRPPRGFRGIQAVDLTGWSPEHLSPAFDAFLTDLGALLGAPRAENLESAPRNKITPSEVFIMHSHADDARGWVQQLSTDLSKDLQALTREPPQIYSAHHINPLDPWRRALVEAGDTARMVVVISSPNFLTSKWCARECEIFWRRASREATARSRIAVVELRPITDVDIERILEQLHGLPEFIDPREMLQILKQFTHIAFYEENSSGVPIPLALVLNEAGAHNTPDYERYAGRVYALASRIKEMEDKLRRQDEERLPAIWNLPAPSRAFTGREHLLKELRSHLGPSADRGRTAAVLPRVVLYGLGGVGKTQLALEHAYRHAADYDLAWWIPAQDTLTIPTALAQLASQLCIPERDDQVQLAGAVLEALRARSRWLLVFDNAEEPNDLARWLPAGGGGHVLITSRHPNWGALADPLKVGVLEHEKAVELLLRRSHSDDTANADKLAEELGDLPLALEQAAAYLEGEGTPLADYLDAFRRLRGQLLRRGRAIAYEDQVDTTWQLSIDKVARAGVELLRLCAFLAPEAIPLDLFATQPTLLPSALRAAVDTNPGLGVHEAAGACYRYSLVDRDQARIRVHRLVQQVVRARLAESDRQAANATVIELLAAAFPTTIEELASPRIWPRCAELLPHLLTAAGHAKETQAAEVITANLLRRAGSYLERRGDYRAARRVLELALAMVEAARGPDHVEVAYALNALGFLLHNQQDPDPKDLAAARTYHERALRIIQAAAPGPQGEDEGRTLNNLGHVLYLQRDLLGARVKLEEGLTVSRTALGDEHPEVATALNYLGLVYRAQGELGAARTAHEQALAIKEAHHEFGPNSPSAATTRWLLSKVLQDEGDSAGARAQLERAHTIFQAALGPEHPDTQAVSRQLASHRSRNVISELKTSIISFCRRIVVLKQKLCV